MADSILIMETGRIVSREDPAFVTVRPASEAGRNIFARGLPVISALDRVEAAGRVMLGVPPDLSGASYLPRVRALGAALGVPVEAGPVEATAIGNILCQALAKGEVKSVAEMRKIEI